MAAPMTSSEDFPAGISWAVTFWSGFALFQESTTCLPQAISWALFEYQMVIGPLAVAASELLAAPEPHAVSTSAPAMTAAAKAIPDRRCTSAEQFHGGSFSGSGCFVARSADLPAAASAARGVEVNGCPLGVGGGVVFRLRRRVVVGAGPVDSRTMSWAAGS